MDKETFDGYELFNDVDDPELRARNRANVVKNMFNDYAGKGGYVARKHIQVIAEYISLFAQEERTMIARALQELKNEQDIIV